MRSIPKCLGYTATTALGMAGALPRMSLSRYWKTLATMFGPMRCSTPSGNCLRAIGHDGQQDFHEQVSDCCGELGSLQHRRYIGYLFVKILLSIMTNRPQTVP